MSATLSRFLVARLADTKRIPSTSDPGNTNNSWKRQLFADLAHGVTMINLFDFDTSWEGYTCDYVDGDGVRLMMPFSTCVHPCR